MTTLNVSHNKRLETIQLGNSQPEYMALKCLEYKAIKKTFVISCERYVIRIVAFRTLSVCLVQLHELIHGPIKRSARRRIPKKYNFFTYMLCKNLLFIRQTKLQRISDFSNLAINTG